MARLYFTKTKVQLPWKQVARAVEQCGKLSEHQVRELIKKQQEQINMNAVKKRLVVRKEDMKKVVV